MGNHYVVGDIHGCYDDLMLLLEKINKKDADAQIILLGDLIDRGPKTWEVLQWAVEHITEDGKYQCVRGNHEQQVLDWYPDFCSWWNEKVQYGSWGAMPKTTYDFSKVMKKHKCLSPRKMKPFISLFEQMPYSKKIEIPTIYGKTVNYRIVHGWYQYDEPEDSEKQKHSNLWERNYWGQHSADEIIVHGHTPTFVQDYTLRGRNDAPGMICYRPDAINLDCGCCYSEAYLQKVPRWMWLSNEPRMLGAICLETLEEIYPYTVKERFLQVTMASVETKRESEERAAIYAEMLTENYEENYRKKQHPWRESILQKMGKEGEKYL